MLGTVWVSVDVVGFKIKIDNQGHVIKSWEDTENGNFVVKSVGVCKQCRRGFEISERGEVKTGRTGNWSLSIKARDGKDYEDLGRRRIPKCDPMKDLIKRVIKKPKRSKV